MPAITQFPTVVENALPIFADLFDCEPQRRHFAEYLTGLMIATNKTVSGINSEFADTTDQSCLNRFLTSVDWNVEELNEYRLGLLQQDDATRYEDKGVIAIDNVLIDHSGKMIEDVGYLWDHAEERCKIAHDYIIANYVCGSGKHYPLNFRRFQKRDQCETRGEPFHDHSVLLRDLVDWVCDHEIPGDFTFDSYFTSTATLNYIASKQNRFGGPRGYVADIKFNRKISYRGKVQRIDEFLSEIKPASRKELRRGDERQWYFSCTIRIPDVDHKVRLVAIWQNRRDSSPRKVIVTNQVNWEVKRTLKCYRYRWTGTETFHRDGKQFLGMGDCQLRSGQGQTRHMHLVMLAYSLLMLELKHNRAKKWALTRLSTIGEACRAMIKEALTDTIGRAIYYVVEKKMSMTQAMAQLGLT